MIANRESEMTKTCPIWKTEATFEPTSGDRSNIDSWRAGGRFSLTGSAETTLRGWGDDKSDARAALSQAILDANINGTTLYLSTKEIQDGSSLLRKRSYAECLNLLLKSVVNLFPELGADFFTHGLNNPEYSRDFGIALGWQEIDFDKRWRGILMTYLKHAADEGLVEFADRSCRLTLLGHEFVSNLGLQSTSQDSIFVAMWFGDTLVNDYFRNAVKPAIEAAGYRCVRIDETHHNERIDEQILAEIRKSRAVIVDMTCGLAAPHEWSASEIVGAPRGGVYFEAGYAAGLNIPIIWTVERDRAEHENVVHFDVRQYNQYRWDCDHEENLKFLQARIEATLGKGSADES